MSLRERLSTITGSGAEGSGPRASLTGFGAVSDALRAELGQRLDFVRTGALDDDELREQIRHLLATIIEERGIVLADNLRSEVIAQVEDETLGLGPIERLLSDPTITDILVNGHRRIYVERFGKLELTDVTFRSDTDLLQVIDRIVARVGRHIDESSPMVDARLADGSRVNAIIPPLALDGPTLSIRRFGARSIDINDLLAWGTMTPAMTDLLRGAVRARLNVIVSGGTGSGKTTLLNALSGFIPPGERIITIEDSAELRLLQPHVVRLESRPPNVEGAGEVTARELVKNALRMRPERIVVGECRGGEALDMLQAMNTGHDGSMTTLHANSTRDVLARLETLVLFSGLSIPERAIRQQIASAVQLIVHVSRLADGTRRVTSISEVTGIEEDRITTSEIFTFRRLGLNHRGEVDGRFEPTGIVPGFVDRLRLTGTRLDLSIFEPDELPEARAS